MPIPVEVEGAAGKGQLDKKKAESGNDDLSEFYFQSRGNWNESYFSGENVEKQESTYNDIFFKYDYHSAYEKEKEDAYEFDPWNIFILIIIFNRYIELSIINSNRKINVEQNTIRNANAGA